MEELEEIRERYKRRAEGHSSASASAIYYENQIRKEREDVIRRLIGENYPVVDNLKILEIGAGSGGNVPLYHSMGFSDQQIMLNELLDDRIKILKEKYPSLRVFPGDAMLIDPEEKFDIVFQFTVFTSILDNNFRTQLANKMLQVLKPGACIIWYDFIYDNPANKDVKGVSKKELRKLFPGCAIRIFPVSLAPPIGRRIGKLYGILNTLFPFLRTHVVAEIRLS